MQTYHITDDTQIHNTAASFTVEDIQCLAHTFCISSVFLKSSPQIHYVLFLVTFSL